MTTCATCKQSFLPAVMHVWTGPDGWKWICVTCRPCGEPSCKRCV